LGVIDRKGGVDLCQNAVNLLLAECAVPGIPGYMVGSALGFSSDLYFSPCRLM